MKEMKQVKIGERLVGEGCPTFIIAEIGVNHNGQIDIVKKLIDVAVQGGADAVKFQRRSLNQIYQEEILKNPNLGEQSFQYLLPILKEFELSEQDYREIVRICREKNIIFLCTPWDTLSVDFLEDLEVPAYKVASADLTNFPLIEYIASKKKPMILSTGMSREDEINKTVNFLKERNAEFVLLHCNSTYPAPFKEIHLRYMEKLREFGVPVGYSGHERGIAISTAAVALGACVIERHITLDRTMRGPDHAASLEPPGFQKMVRDIRQLELALGVPKKKINQGEVLNRELLAKSLVAKVSIPKGTIISKEMITAKSPGKGISPQRLYELAGRTAARDIQMDENFIEEDFGSISSSSNFVNKLDSTYKWGLKVRFNDFDQLVTYNPNFVEFHFTDKDIDVPFQPSRNYEQELYVHAPEYQFRSLIDLCSMDEKIRVASVEFIQRSIQKTKEIAPYFKGKPRMILHVGGMSLEPILDTRPLLENLERSLSELRLDGVELLLENLPPNPWFFGGQWISNVFMDATEIRDFCRRKGYPICFDSSHAKLYCNFKGISMAEYISTVKPFTKHLHISDGAGFDAEGLQIDEGEIDFSEIFRLFQGQEYTLVPEIWRGHQNGGQGFFIALERLSKYFVSLIDKHSPYSKIDEMNNKKCYLCGSEHLNVIRAKLRYDINRNVLECQECSFVFLEPQSKNLEEYYSGDYRKTYSPVINTPLSSKEIFDIYLPLQKSIINRIKYLLNPESRVLEVGCSAGHFLYAIQDKVKECIGVELNKLDAKFVNEELKIKVYNCQIEETDLEDNSFDLIYANQVLEHIGNPINFLTKLSKYLKPTGKIVFQVPNLHDPLLSLYHSKEYSDFWFKEPHISYFSPKTLLKTFEKASFSGKVFPVQDYGFINHLNWILNGKPQKSVTEGVSEPVLLNSNLVSEEVKNDFNDWIKKVNEEYLSLLNKHKFGEYLLFIGEKTLS